MGLGISHGCYSGSYGRFSRFRDAICEAAELPPLDFMEGFFHPGNARVLKEEWLRNLPIRWSCLRPDILFELLNHSDCDGSISWKVCKKLALRLEELKPLKPHMSASSDSIYEKHAVIMDDFIIGLKVAYKEKEDIEFC